MAILYLKTDPVTINLSAETQEDLEYTETTLDSWSDLDSYKETHFVDSPPEKDIIDKLDDFVDAETLTSTECYYNDSTYHKLTFTEDSELNEIKSLIDAGSGWNVLQISYIDKEDFDTAESQTAEIRSGKGVWHNN